MDIALHQYGRTARASGTAPDGRRRNAVVPVHRSVVLIMTATPPDRTPPAGDPHAGKGGVAGQGSGKCGTQRIRTSLRKSTVPTVLKFTGGILQPVEYQLAAIARNTTCDDDQKVRQAESTPDRFRAQRRPAGRLRRPGGGGREDQHRRHADGNSAGVETAGPSEKKKQEKINCLLPGICSPRAGTSAILT